MRNNCVLAFLATEAIIFQANAKRSRHSNKRGLIRGFKGLIKPLIDVGTFQKKCRIRKS